ncbi:hypothetical protein ACOMHN_002492 [Nucella lapillus]
MEESSREQGHSKRMNGIHGFYACKMELSEYVSRQQNGEPEKDVLRLCQREVLYRERIKQDQEQSLEVNAGQMLTGQMLTGQMLFGQMLTGKMLY